MGDYDDIINLPHYEPKHHPRMPMEARAAQFAPFAAVAGHDAAIREEGRITEEWVEPGETDSEELNRKMQLLVSHLPEQPTLAVEYFLPDAHKSGGAYLTATGTVRRISVQERVMEFTDGRKITIDSIKDIRLHEE